MGTSYESEEELGDTVDKLGRVFDVARLVDPILTDIEGQAHEPQDDCDCYGVWGKDARCKNCTSSRVLVTGETAHKYECIGDDIYFVTSERVETPEGARVLELVSRMESRFEQHYRDQQQKMTELEELSVLAFHDPLTGIYNRHYAEEQVPKLVEHVVSEGDDVLLAIVDIDKLKTANDVFGHLAGDLLIRTVTSRVLRVFPACGEENGFFARIGGDEFVLVKRVKDKQESDALLASIVKSVADGGLEEYPEINVSVSVGGVLNSEFEGTRFTDFLARADVRLYDAKRSGRGRYVSEGDGQYDPPEKVEGEKRRFRRDA